MLLSLVLEVEHYLICAPLTRCQIISLSSELYGKFSHYRLSPTNKIIQFDYFHLLLIGALFHQARHYSEVTRAIFIAAARYADITYTPIRLFSFNVGALHSAPYAV